MAWRVRWTYASPPSKKCSAAVNFLQRADFKPDLLLSVSHQKHETIGRGPPYGLYQRTSFLGILVPATS